MTWQPLATIQTTADWILTEPVTGSVFRAIYNVTGTNSESLRGVIAQVFTDSNTNTYFDFRRLAYKPENEGLVFIQPGGLLNRKLAIKRLDNLTDSWTITIEVLDGMPTSISLPIQQSEVMGLEQALGSKAAAESLNFHVQDTNNPHNVTAEDVGAEPKGAIATHAGGVDHPLATPTEKGLMSKDDKNSLNKIVNYAFLNVIKNAQSIASNSDTILTFPTVSSDSSASWNSTTNQWTCPATGFYLIGANVDLINNATADNVFVLIVYRNGAVGRRFETNNANPPNAIVQLGKTFALDLVTGDLIDLRLRCPLVTSSTPVSVSAGGMFFIQRVK